MQTLATAFFAIALFAVSTITQALPDFSGAWKLDVESTRLSERPRRGIQTYEIAIRQTVNDITVENPTARWGAQSVTYVTDGRERVVVDDSLGELENFARKLRIQAIWDGRVLTLRTTPFGEQNDSSGAIYIPAGAITNVQTFRLDGKLLRLDTTGFREAPPSLLHGIPYKPFMDERLRTGFTEVFRR